MKGDIRKKRKRTEKQLRSGELKKYPVEWQKVSKEENAAVIGNKQRDFVTLQKDFRKAMTKCIYQEAVLDELRDTLSYERGKGSQDKHYVEFDGTRHYVVTWEAKFNVWLNDLAESLASLEYMRGALKKYGLDEKQINSILVDKKYIKELPDITEGNEVIEGEEK